MKGRGYYKENIPNKEVVLNKNTGSYHNSKVPNTLKPLTPVSDQDRLNFSLQYQYNIKQTSDENKEKYWSRTYKLIQYQILQTNITRTVWQTVERITNTILGV